MLAVLMAVPLVALAACGGGAGADTAADPRSSAAESTQRATPALTSIDACSLLTGDEVRAILGQDASGAPDPASGFDLSCYWHASGRSREVSVEVGRLEPAASLRREFDTFKTNMVFREDVSGIGDAAFLAQYGGSGSALVVRSDDLLVFVNTTEPDRDGALKKLGPVVLGRLQ